MKKLELERLAKEGVPITGIANTKPLKTLYPSEENWKDIIDATKA
jgi:hypothetical protein